MANAASVPPELDDFARLKRYLCTSDDLSSGIAECIGHLANDGKGEQAVETLCDFASVANRKLVVGVLAMCTAKNLKTKQAAYEALNAVCITPPLLFHFLDSVAKQSTKGKSGFGRAKRKAIAKWYNGRSLKELAVFVTRYRRRSHWSHTDLVRLAHTKPGNPGVDFIFKYVTKGLAAAKEHLTDKKSDELQDVIKYLDAVERVKHSNDEQEVAHLVQEFQLSHEHVPTWLIKDSREVWSALLSVMPLSSILSHLNKMASIGLLESGPNSPLEALKSRLANSSLIKELQPFSVQIALKSYEGGKAKRSMVTWNPNNDIKDALRDLYYKVISLYEPTGRRYLVAVDVGSMMFNNMAGVPQMTSVWAAASLSMGILRKETNRHLLAVAGKTVSSIDVASRDLTVEGVCENLHQKKGDGALVLSRVFEWAQEKKEAVDIFIIFTDYINFKSLADDFRKYRDDTKCQSTRLVVALMGKSHDRNTFGIQQQNDPGVLLLKGLNPAFPSVVSHFLNGKLDSHVNG